MKSLQKLPDDDAVCLSWRPWGFGFPCLMSSALRPSPGVLQVWLEVWPGGPRRSLRVTVPTEDLSQLTPLTTLRLTRTLYSQLSSLSAGCWGGGLSREHSAAAWRPGEWSQSEHMSALLQRLPYSVSILTVLLLATYYLSYYLLLIVSLLTTYWLNKSCMFL